MKEMVKGKLKGKRLWGQDGDSFLSLAENVTAPSNRRGSLRGAHGVIPSRETQFLLPGALCFQVLEKKMGVISPWVSLLLKNQQENKQKRTEDNKQASMIQPY